MSSRCVHLCIDQHRLIINTIMIACIVIANTFVYIHFRRTLQSSVLSFFLFFCFFFSFNAFCLTPLRMEKENNDESVCLIKLQSYHILCAIHCRSVCRNNFSQPFAVDFTHFMASVLSPVASFSDIELYLLMLALLFCGIGCFLFFFFSKYVLLEVLSTLPFTGSPHAYQFD